jgi:hypothetical protein
MSASKVLSPIETARLQKLMESAPLCDMATGTVDYYKRLREQGMNKNQAFALTYQMHECLCAAIFYEKVQSGVDD